MRFDHPTQSMISDLRCLWKQAFGDTDDSVDQFFATAFSFDRSRCVMENGQLAAALYWFDCEFEGRKIAYIYAVATAMSFRRQGLCHELMKDTHKLLAQAGYAGAILVPGSTSLASLYSSLGYHYSTYLRERYCTAAPEPVSLRQIDATEYARLRREMLPEGSVIQEGENLRFLQTQAKFYAGTHLLLAAQKDGQNLMVFEYLGDCSAAPGILTALGAAQGRIRSPGNERPFAMYLSFDGTSPPDYFAFAFD